jgi:hypothetical protein
MEPTETKILHILTYTNHETYPDNFAYAVQYVYNFEHEGKKVSSAFTAELNTDNTDNYILWEELTEETVWSWISDEELASTKAVAMQQANDRLFPNYTTHEVFPWEA